MNLHVPPAKEHVLRVTAALLSNSSKYFFTQHPAEYHQSHEPKTQRVRKTYHRISFSAFNSLTFSSVSIYSYQNPATQLQTFQPSEKKKINKRKKEKMKNQKLGNLECLQTGNRRLDYGIILVCSVGRPKKRNRRGLPGTWFSVLGTHTKALCNVRPRREPLGGSGGILPQKMFIFRASEIPFPMFSWGNFIN